MMVPYEFDSFPKATGTLPLTTPTSVAPIPTVVPDTPIYQDLNDTGQRTLWVVTVIMGISSLVFYTLAARAPLSKRVLHTTTSLITTFSFITYLALSTGQGLSYTHRPITHYHKHVPNVTDDFYRQILWLRYINWALSTPLILLNFALISGLAGASLVVAVAANFVMLAAGLLGSFAGHEKMRWVWLSISCVSYLVMLHHGGFHAQRAAGNKDARTRKSFAALSGLGFVAFALFPIALAAGSLALKISVDVETVLLAIQDIFTQGLLGYWLLLAHDGAQGTSLDVDGFWSSGVGNEGAIRITEEDGA